MLLLKLLGSDTESPPVQWEVVSGLVPWLTINSFHVISPPLESCITPATSLTHLRCCC